MKKTIFLILLFFIGCATKKIPQWYMKTYPQSNRFLYATGEGKTLDGAVKNALAFAAGKIYIKIKSRYNALQTQYKTQNENIYTDYSSLNIKSFTKNIVFSSYKILKKYKGDKFYVLIKIDRINNARNLCNSISVFKFPEQNDLEFLFNSKLFFKKTQSIIQNLQITNLIYPLCNKKLKNALEIKKRLIKRLNSIKISISGDNVLKDYLNELLQKYIKTAQNADIKVIIQNKPAYKKIAELYIVSMNINIVFKNKKEKKILELNCAASSLENFSLSRKLTYEKCKEKIKNILENYLPNSSFISLSSSF